MATENPQAKLQSLSEEFQKLQQGECRLNTRRERLTYNYADLQETVNSRQRLEGQKQENVGVQNVQLLHRSLSLHDANP